MLLEISCIFSLYGKEEMNKNYNMALFLLENIAEVSIKVLLFWTLHENYAGFGKTPDDIRFDTH